MEFLRRHKLIAATIAIQIVALPLLLLLVREQQDTRTSALQATNLYFEPASNSNSPIEAEIETNVVPIDLMIDPDTNFISFAKLEITYDPAHLSPVGPDATDSVVVNTDAFPVTVEGPIMTPGKIQINLSVGSSQEKVIQEITKVLTLNFKAVGETNPTTNVTINTDNTQLLSTAPQDTATENVLETSTPAVVKVNPAPPPPDTTPPTIINPRAINITETTATITWDIDENGTGKTEYGLTTSYGGSTTEECCATTFAQDLSNLTPDTLYHFRVISKDEAGNQSISNDYTFRTLVPPDTTPPTIINPRAINITENSATIVWETDEPANGNAVYGLTTSYGGTTTPTPCCTEIFAHDVTGLTPDTVYNFRVTSVDEAGNSATSSNYTFRTLPPIFTTLNFIELKLHGLGSGGDNPNPTSWGTLNPLRPVRLLNVQLFDTTGTLVDTAEGTINYSGPDTGIFTGSVAFDDSKVDSGNYTVKVGTPYYLTRQVPGFLTLTQGQSHDIIPTSLVAGDVNLDNFLQVSDYDLIMACYSDLEAPRDCADPAKKQAADISDDGLVNQDDYNLFMRELSVQAGD